MNALALTLVACGTSARGDLAGVDAGRPNATGARDDSGPHGPDKAWDPDVSTMLSLNRVGVGIDGCNDADPETRLEMIPGNVSVFQQVPAGCALGSAVLLRNSGDEALRIDGLGGTIPEYLIESPPLPFELSPGAFMPVRLHNAASTVGSKKDAGFQVATSRGCQYFGLIGVATDELLITRSHEALDFGKWPVGEASDVRHISIVPVLDSFVASSQFAGFSTDKPDVFEVVEAPPQNIQAVECEPLKIALRFKAPTTPGRIEGSVAWYSTVDLAGSLAEAFATIQLFGEATVP